MRPISDNGTTLCSARRGPHHSASEPTVHTGYLRNILILTFEKMAPTLLAPAVLLSGLDQLCHCSQNLMLLRYIYLLPIQLKIGHVVEHNPVPDTVPRVTTSRTIQECLC
ncbi:hypothetical protein PR048_026748 [Dryococelus australis]|uniref:Uncharacterized protein n=1 Tax=Dryococelus australis TaxID=614101 RepID=A0ABQ9GM86_9NEOP|nr:hypothetical protein PR048_026748 [Dryococelus australis]